MEPKEVEGILITVKEIVYNSNDKCPSTCVNAVENRDCPYKKKLSIKPNANEVISNKVFLNIKNKTEKTWSSSSGQWELIDTEGFAFRAEAICEEIKPLRMFDFRGWSLSPKTQANYFLIFPEIENKIAKIIYANKGVANEFIIEQYSNEIEDSFKYDKPITKVDLAPSKMLYDNYGVPTFRTTDGHFVRSQKEVIVDDYLFDKKINHIYECGLPGLEGILCDWYLPDLKTFVEYWGISNDEKYEANKKKKIQVYEANEFNLISIEKNEIENLDQNFTEKLARLGMSIDNNLQIANSEIALNNSFVSIDFETANQNRNSACALGIVIVENNIIKIKKEYSIKPPTQFFTFTSYHGITWADVKDSPTFAEIWNEIRMIFDCYPNIVAHNMTFDKGVISALAEFYKLELPTYNYICTLQESKKYINSENHKLETIAKLLNIHLLHHNALSDANAAAEILIHVNGLKI